MMGGRMGWEVRSLMSAWDFWGMGGGLCGK